MFVDRASQLEPAGLVMAVAAAAAADVVVDFSASSAYALAASAPVSHGVSSQVKHCVTLVQVVTAPLDLPSHRVAGGHCILLLLLFSRACMGVSFHRKCPDANYSLPPNNVISVTPR